MDYITFKHSGNAGDIIYSLAGIKHICGKLNRKAKLYIWLDRKAFYYEGATHPLGGVMMNAYMFNHLKPLLESQDYIESVESWSHAGYPKIQVNLDAIREVSEYIGMPNGNIARWYFYKYPDMATDLSVPWLKIDEKDNNFLDVILVNRTSRYQNPHIEYSLLQDYPNVVFTGVYQEYQEFKKQVPNAAYLDVKDFHELAVAIKSCKVFVGNQSFCFSLAEAMKVPRILEVCNFAPNVIPEGKNGYDYYFKEGFKTYLDMFMENKGEWRDGVEDDPDYDGTINYGRIGDIVTPAAWSEVGLPQTPWNNWQKFKEYKYPVDGSIKIYHTSGDKHGRIDGVIEDNFVKMTNRVDSMAEADVVCLDLSWFEAFVFDPTIFDKIKLLNKKVVVVDYIEYGKVMEYTHCLGASEQNYDNWNHFEYECLENHMRSIHQNIIGYFKREKTAYSNLPYPVFPIDYYAQHDNEPSYPWAPEARDIDILMIWGMSNPIRPKVAGELIKMAFEKGRQLATTVEQCDHIDGQKVAVLFKPDFDRMHPSKMYELQSRAKITISLPGSGVKCFRDSEAPFNSIMAKMQDNVTRAYDWHNRLNCLSLDGDEGEFVNEIFEKLDSHHRNLKDIYQEGQKTMRKYMRHNYVNNYILKNIKLWISNDNSRTEK